MKSFPQTGRSLKSRPLVLPRVQLAAPALYPCDAYLHGWHEGVTQPMLMAALQSAGVKFLAQVSAVPLSRRPDFPKNVLAAILREAAIDYIGMKALGTPPEWREAARKNDLKRLASVYAGQLELPEVLAQMSQLRSLASGRLTALLSFERDPPRCHRALLVQAAFPEAEVTDLFA